MCALKNKKIATPALVNAEEMHRENPESFWIPESRLSMKPGDFAKVAANGDRFWVEITAVDDSIITGAVASVLVDPSNRKLKYGSLMQFAPCNVYQVMRDKEFLD